MSRPQKRMQVLLTQEFHFVLWTNSSQANDFDALSRQAVGAMNVTVLFLQSLLLDGRVSLQTSR